MSIMLKRVKLLLYKKNINVKHEPYYCLENVNLPLYFLGNKSLQFQQFNSWMQRFATLKEVAMPPTGWIKAIRTDIGMSMQQLGNKSKVTQHGVTLILINDLF